ncbi:MAG: PAS domain S-box protein, partial [Desulfurivibrionaceae bacterium]|nr:PAS domain S-box protein [Desulfurivibrionaceae bacterium]
WQMKSPKDERWYNITNTTINNDDGTHSRQSLLVDITEEYLAREELALLSTLINQSNDAIFIIDADTSAFIYVNHKACSNLGYSAAELLALRVIDISGSLADIAAWSKQVARIHKQGLIFESAHIRKDGSRFPVEITTSHVLRDGKNFLISVVRDISARQAQTRALRHEKNKFESLLATLTDGITVQDRDFKILYQNKVHIEKQGLHTRKYCYQAYQHRDTICDGCLLVQSFADDKVHRQVTSATTPKGIIHLEVTASPMKDADGKIIAGIESVRDITARIKLEERLRHAEKMAAMGTLAGGVAHDFNNILTPILGYAELALSSLAPSDPQAGHLQQISQAAERAKDLVKQILVFSRHAPQEKKPLQPQLIVKEVLKLLQASLPSTITIRAEFAAACGTILADPTQFHQITMNLCTNAYQAMQESGGMLGVRLSQITLEDDSKIPGSDLAAGNYLLLEVSDSGCGIKKKTMAHIFDPYFTTKNKGEGTGLGLAVVHGIVKSYQGDITVYSELGKGTNFHVYLPSLEEPPSLPETHGPIPIPIGTEHLLVVDDEKMITTMLQKILLSLGYEVTVFNNSLEALACIEESPMLFELLITDMTMPHLTGVELARKALIIRPDLPVVLCTGFSDLTTKEEVQDLGIQAYMMKPISVRELGQTVRDLLDSALHCKGR